MLKAVSLFDKSLKSLKLRTRYLCTQRTSLIYGVDLSFKKSKIAVLDVNSDVPRLLKNTHTESYEWTLQPEKVANYNEVLQNVKSILESKNASTPYEVCLSVPSSLSVEERSSILRAADEVGVNVSKLVEEPVAAIAASRLSILSGYYVVVNFGSDQSVSLSLVNGHNGNSSVIAHTRLGDFEDAIKLTLSKKVGSLYDRLIGNLFNRGRMSELDIEEIHLATRFCMKDFETKDESTVLIKGKKYTITKSQVESVNNQSQSGINNHIINSVHSFLEKSIEIDRRTEFVFIGDSQKVKQFLNSKVSSPIFDHFKRTLPSYQDNQNIFFPSLQTSTPNESHTEGAVAMGATLVGSSGNPSSIYQKLGYEKNAEYNLKLPIIDYPSFWAASLLNTASRQPLPLPTTVQFENVVAQELFDPLLFKGNAEQIKQSHKFPLPSISFAMVDDPLTHEKEYYARLDVTASQFGERRPRVELNVVIDITNNNAPLYNRLDREKFNDAAEWEELINALSNWQGYGSQSVNEVEKFKRYVNNMHKHFPHQFEKVKAQSLKFVYARSPSIQNVRSTLDWVIDQLRGDDSISISIRRNDGELDNLLPMTPIPKAVLEYEAALEKFEDVQEENYPYINTTPDVAKCVQKAADLFHLDYDENDLPLLHSPEVLERRVLYLSDTHPIQSHLPRQLGENDMNDAIDNITTSLQKVSKKAQYTTIATLDGTKFDFNSIDKVLKKVRGATAFSFDGLRDDAMFHFRNTDYGLSGKKVNSGKFIQTIVPKFFEVKVLPMFDNYTIEKSYGRHVNKGVLNRGSVLASLDPKFIQETDEELIRVHEARDKVTGKPVPMKTYDGYPFGYHPFDKMPNYKPWSQQIAHRPDDEPVIVSSKDVIEPALYKARRKFDSSNRFDSSNLLNSLQNTLRKDKEKGKSLTTLSDNYWSNLFEEMGKNLSNFMQPIETELTTMQWNTANLRYKNLQLYLYNSLIYGQIKHRVNVKSNPIPTEPQHKKWHSDKHLRPDMESIESGIESISKDLIRLINEEKLAIEIKKKEEERLKAEEQAKIDEENARKAAEEAAAAAEEGAADEGSTPGEGETPNKGEPKSNGEEKQKPKEEKKTTNEEQQQQQQQEEGGPQEEKPKQEVVEDKEKQVDNNNEKKSDINEDEITEEDLREFEEPKAVFEEVLSKENVLEVMGGNFAAHEDMIESRIKQRKNLFLSLRKDKTSKPIPKLESTITEIDKEEIDSYLKKEKDLHLAKYVRNQFLSQLETLQNTIDDQVSKLKSQDWMKLSDEEVNTAINKVIVDGIKSLERLKQYWLQQLAADVPIYLPIEKDEFYIPENLSFFQKLIYPLNEVGVEDETALWAVDQRGTDVTLLKLKRELGVAEDTLISKPSAIKSVIDGASVNTFYSQSVEEINNSKVHLVVNYVDRQLKPQIQTFTYTLKDGKFFPYYSEPGIKKAILLSKMTDALQHFVHCKYVSSNTVPEQPLFSQPEIKQINVLRNPWEIELEIDEKRFAQQQQQQQQQSSQSSETNKTQTTQSTENNNENKENKQESTPQPQTQPQMIPQQPQPILQPETQQQSQQQQPSTLFQPQIPLQSNGIPPSQVQIPLQGPNLGNIQQQQPEPFQKPQQPQQQQPPLVQPTFPPNQELAFPTQQPQSQFQQPQQTPQQQQQPPQQYQQPQQPTFPPQSAPNNLYPPQQPPQQLPQQQSTQQPPQPNNSYPQQQQQQQPLQSSQSPLAFPQNLHQSTSSPHLQYPTPSSQQPYSQPPSNQSTYPPTMPPMPGPAPSQPFNSQPPSNQSTYPPTMPPMPGPAPSQPFMATNQNTQFPNNSVIQTSSFPSNTNTNPNPIIYSNLRNPALSGPHPPPLHQQPPPSLQYNGGGIQQNRNFPTIYHPPNQIYRTNNNFPIMNTNQPMGMPPYGPFYNQSSYPGGARGYPTHTYLVRSGSPQISIPHAPKVITSTVDDKKKQEEDSAIITKVGGVLASKLAQLSVITANYVQNRLTGVDNLFKKGKTTQEGLVAPPNSYSPTIYQAIKDEVLFSETQVEQLYYIFIQICGADEGSVNFLWLMTLFPTTIEDEIKDIIHLLFLQPGENTIDFLSFIKVLSKLSLGSAEDRLNIIFTVLTHIHSNGTTDKKDAVLSISDISNTFLFINSKMSSQGFTQNDDPQQILDDIKSIFVDSCESITREKFLELGSKSFDLILCFGLFPFIVSYTVERVMYSMDVPLSPAVGWIPYKEGYLLKNFQTLIHEKFSYHWCIVSHGNFIYYSDVEKLNKPQRVNSLINAVVTKYETEDKKYGFELKIPPAYSRRFICSSESERNSWAEVIEYNASAQKRNRFASSFPVRTGISGEFYVDGKETYRAMCSAIRAAKESIFICDWFFSCEVYLIRDSFPLKDEDRLDIILRKKAEEGVQISILIWNETKIATTLNSEYVQKKMEDLNPPGTNNIKVQRHPFSYPVKWSHHQKILVIDQDVAFIGGLDLCFGRFDDCNHNIVDVDMKRGPLPPNASPFLAEAPAYTWPGKDYYNPGIKQIDNVEKFNEDSFDRNKLPRMPWHDVHVKVDGEAARDVAANFIERWNFTKGVLERITVPDLIPKTGFVQYPYNGTLNVQVIRSLGNWHLPNFEEGKPENSIYQAYLHYIANAEHFIYIENQYFISSTSDQESNVVKNQIAQTILDRISKAIDLNERFKVIVILPIHPEGSKDDAGIRYIMKWQFDTISRSKSSLFRQLRDKYPHTNIEEYISFNALRKSQLLPTTNTFVTEQIYVHTKLMIVDDRVVIVGSANINDRSMDGDRDSEIALVIEDNKLIESKMNNKPYHVGELGHNLRVKLMKEHLGIVDNTDQRGDLIKDPVCNGSWDLWKETENRNTDIYRQVFPKTPHDHIAYFSDLVDQTNTNTYVGGVPLQPDPPQTPLAYLPALPLIYKLQGNLIKFPTNLWSKESLDPDLDAIEIKMADIDIFT
eukprot:TRINITY_DN1494_c0_g2_i1.p1 TRINITY_DN1494_c0_g2~~TRINITY_DN1494_c0_g2_i1.p1  ORF type:complete len:2944 (-),score=819.76 TRINITY_DN1494_c0_g2_i1:104-8935(-)